MKPVQLEEPRVVERLEVERINRNKAAQAGVLLFDLKMASSYWALSF